MRLAVPSVYGWYYRLSRVISGGQSRHLTLCSPGSPSPSWTPVLPSHGKAAADPKVRPATWYKGRDVSQREDTLTDWGARCLGKKGLYLILLRSIGRPFFHSRPSIDRRAHIFFTYLLSHLQLQRPVLGEV